MENLNNDLENNRKLMIIEESISRALLRDDIKEPNECIYYTLQMFVVITLYIIILVLITIILLLFRY